MSFSDLMSSAKGPGVIGLLLGILVLVGFVLLGTLALDDKFQGGEKTLSATINQQERDIEIYRNQLNSAQDLLKNASARDLAASNLRQVMARIESQEKSIAASHLQISGLNDEISSIGSKQSDYRKEYRKATRDAARGNSMPTLTTLDGEVMHDITIREVNAFGMQVTHRDGVKRIPYDKLPLALQEHFQFDPEETKAAASVEAQAQESHNRSAEAALEAARVNALKRQQDEKNEAVLRKQQALSALTSRLSDLESEIRDLNNDIDSESRKTVSQAPRLRLQLASKEKEKAQIKVKLRSLSISPSR